MLRSAMKSRLDGNNEKRERRREGVCCLAKARGSVLLPPKDPQAVGPPWAGGPDQPL